MPFLNGGVGGRGGGGYFPEIEIFPGRKVVAQETAKNKTVHAQRILLELDRDFSRPNMHTLTEIGVYV